MVDMLGREVKVGDRVVFNMPRYSNLGVATICKITYRGISCKWSEVLWLNGTEEMTSVHKSHWGGEFLSRTREQFVKLEE